MAIMQDDGNFVIYKGNKESGIPIWSTLTQDPYKGEYFVFQNNGNIEVFSQNELIWTANTKNEHANKLIMYIYIYLTKKTVNI